MGVIKWAYEQAKKKVIEEFKKKDDAAFRRYVDELCSGLGLDKGKCKLSWKEVCRINSPLWRKYCEEEEDLRREKFSRLKLARKGLKKA